MNAAASPLAFVVIVKFRLGLRTVFKTTFLKSRKGPNFLLGPVSVSNKENSRFNFKTSQDPNCGDIIHFCYCYLLSSLLACLHTHRLQESECRRQEMQLWLSLAT